MRHKYITFNISGNTVRLEPVKVSNPLYVGFEYEIRIYGLTADAFTLFYKREDSMSRDLQAFDYLLFRLQQSRPQAWGNSKGVMSRGEIRLMRLAILCGGITVLACLVYLLVILFK